MVEFNPDMERGSTHIWFFNAMLKATEKSLMIKIGELSLLDQGKAEALRTLRLDHRRREVLRVEHGDKSMQGTFQLSESLGRHPGRGPFSQSKDSCPTNGRSCQRREKGLLLAPLEETLSMADGAQTQEKGEDSGLCQAHHDTVRSGAPPEIPPRGIWQGS